MKKFFSIFMLAAIATIACFTLNSCEKEDEINVLFDFDYSIQNPENAMNVNTIIKATTLSMKNYGFNEESGTTVIYKHGGLKKVKDEAKEAFEASIREYASTAKFDNKGITITLRCMNDNSDVASYTFEK